MSLGEIPNELIQEFIVPHLSSIRDVGSAIQVSKKMKECFDTEDVWKKIFKTEKAKVGYKNLLKNHQKSKKWFTDQMTDDYIIDTPLHGQLVKIMVKNETKNIPFEVYCKDYNRYDLKMIKISKEPILPGKAFFRTLTFNRKIICLPTEEWFLENPLSNIGFSFITHVKDVEAITKEHMGILKKFNEPDLEKMKPIKGMRKDYENYKEEVMKRVIDKKKLNKKKNENKKKLDEMEYELKMYKKQMKIMEENVRRLRVGKKDLDYLSDLVN